MSSPGTFERVYAALKEKLRGGHLKPGDRLEPAALSEELFASVTPIRDALHRLTGERLVEAPKQEGFRVPLLSEARLRHLYAWHRDLLLLAIMRRRVANIEDGFDETFDGTGLSHARRELFVAIARATGNPEHVLALESVAERLEPLEALEDALLEGIQRETEAICSAIRSGDARLLKKLLAAYYRRREKIVPELLERMQAE
jgi:DNA-binding GntR family transcriptional regulator